MTGVYEMIIDPAWNEIEKKCKFIKNKWEKQ